MKIVLNVVLFVVMVASVVYAQTDPKFEDYLAAERAALPVEGELLYDASSLGAYRFGGTKKAVDVDPDLPFGTALQLSVAKAGNDAWDPQFQTPANAVPLENGDILFYIFYIRVVETSAQDGNGKALFYVQRNSNPWTSLGSMSITVRPEWQKYYVIAEAKEGFSTGAMEATFHLGFLKQVVEIGGIIALNLGPGIDVGDLPTTPIYYDGMESDAPWRAEADARIDQHRKGDLRIVVKNQNGQPIKNAHIDIEMKNHAFGFGTFMSELALSNSSNANKYKDEILTLFNCATTPFYMGDGNWGWYHSEKNRENYKALAGWLQDNDIPTKGHVLVWPAWRWMPPFFKDLENDPAGLRAAIDEHLATLVPVGGEKGLVQWDVVNEPHINHDVMDICGNEIMIDWYKQVHELHPEARLILKEYNILMGGGDPAFQDDFDYYLNF